MSQFAVKLQCSNPECLYPDNQVGQPLCDRCQTPLSYRHLWVVGAAAEPDSLIDCRYLAVSPQIWLDTQPGLAPKAAPKLPNQALPYLRLHSHRRHLPQIFSLDAFSLDASSLNASGLDQAGKQPIFLLENAPISASGELLPLLREVWAEATPLRQLNWLWQMLRLWQPLQAEGVASSLLAVENLHCEGGQIRLRELLSDEQPAARVPVLSGFVAGEQAIAHIPQVRSSFSLNRSRPPELSDLAELWQAWTTAAHPTIRHHLRDWSEALAETSETGIRDTGISVIEVIEQLLTQRLREQAALLPLQVQTVGGTTTGDQRTHNEDACYPSGQPGGSGQMLPRVGIICDGIGGHAGGEVASQLALRSLQLQLRTWLAELALQPEPLPAEIIEQQLIGMVRVVNNMIATQNDLQGRAQRERMGTTLMLAVQPPSGQGSTGELYLVHVGDSRAYWLTVNVCQLLTVDDDVAGREVRAGRSLYQQVSERPDAAALTQAVGTHEADHLKIHVQRLVLDEDGILLLCSDGLSDHQLVEKSWESLTRPVLQDRLPLPVALQGWLDLAERQNGHDNASVVLMQCRLNSEPQLFEPKAIRKSTLLPQESVEPEPQELHELTDSARALLYDEEPAASKAAVLPKRPAAKTSDGWLLAVGIAAMTFVLGALGVAVWRELAPHGFRPDSVQPAPAVPRESPTETPAE
ncbi:MAG: protein phosphatase 2C domain-containing protein [Pegethrix bostrychoides GSE-TBD4-15B]|jgi:protein phosphatase|uniref:Protein phosphatase 2C domain-containing protein n=1 Tax=Pegethrix bostrychoides GSE-TBD4-15B TaxID=2839662 RepID=A0A951U4K5_9CYAN|nr:protein phosphatase 2C domain-containing protein [Pegethrix bostrychoides GSE-TBD4-15B]